MEKVLSVNGLSVSFRTYAGEINALRGVSFDLAKGETLAIVGESGSGKSVTAKAIMKLLPKQNSKINSGEILYKGRNLVSLGLKEMRKLRGSEISMVFQDPMTSLNPTMTIEKQISEGLCEQHGISKKEARGRALEMLKLVGIPNAEDRLKDYPHQFSGGMRQRVVIAMALASKPNIIIADEPTTALDVTIQAQILELMKDLQQRMATSIILITHDLGVVANMADRVAVMYAGEMIEVGTVDEIFYQPKHPYTWGLLSSMPKLHVDRSEKLQPIAGSPPDVSQLKAGCAFAARCPYAMKICHTHNPEMAPLSETHAASCWLLHSQAPKVVPPVGEGEAYVAETTTC